MTCPPEAIGARAAEGRGQRQAPLPDGAVQTRNDYGSEGLRRSYARRPAPEHRYVSPCPPPLDTDSLGLDKDDAGIVSFNLSGHTIAEGLVIPYATS